MTVAGDKLQKVLASHGLGSRREMERWIEAGRVVVDGQVAAVGLRVDADARIEVDGKRLINAPEAHPRILVLNKKVGTVVTRHDEEGRDTVFRGLPDLVHGRWIAVGRLDINTSGLLLLTNDGTLAHRLMHPSTGIDREYAVRVEGSLSDEAIARLQAGVEIDGVVQRFSDLQYYNGRGRNHWYHVVLMEGRNREVRQLFETAGTPVTRLKRVRYGPVVLPSWLRRGQVAEMAPEEVEQVYRLLGLDYVVPKPARTKKDVGRRGSERSLLIPYPSLQDSR